MIPPYDRSALLVLDMQRDLVEHARLDPASSIASVIDAVRALADRFRARERPVIYSKVCYRSGYADAPANAPARARNSLREGEPGSMIIEELAPALADFVIVKRRVGAFYGTDLEILLRGLGCSGIVVTGTSTPRAVESTAREAHSRDLECVVVADATHSASDEDQADCLRILDTHGFARVVQSVDVLAGLG